MLQLLLELLRRVLQVIALSACCKQIMQSMSVGMH